MTDLIQSENLVEIDATTRGAADEANQRFFAMRVVGQEEAQQAALDAVARINNPLRDPDRPIAVIYELGPSRTGKTLIAETIAELVHGDKRCMVKVNGGAYKERHEVARLVGAPPGYLGYKESGWTSASTDKSAKLTRKNLEAARGEAKVPVTVILVDEANLMHEASDDLFMSIMDKGELDLGNNDVTDFRDCIIIFTSNIGMDEVKRRHSRGRIGFRPDDDTKESRDDSTKTIVMKALEERYRPEWLNRVDQFVVFKQHDDASLHNIVDVELQKFIDRMTKQLPAERQFTLEVEASAKDFLLGTSLADGGNIAQLKRMIQKHLIDMLGNLLAQGKLGKGDVVVVRHNEAAEKLSFLVAPDVLTRSYGNTVQTVKTAPIDEPADTLKVRSHFVSWERRNDPKDEGSWMRLIISTEDSSKSYHIKRTLTCTCGQCSKENTLSWEWVVPYEKGVDPLVRVGDQRLPFICAGCKGRRYAMFNLTQFSTNEWKPTD